MTSKPRYTHKTKGGSYEIILDPSTYKSAGRFRKKGIVVILYRCTETFEVYTRDKEDFDESMELIQ